MRKLEGELEERKEYLGELIIEAETALMKAPKGSLRTNQKKERSQYYLRSKSSDRTGRYPKKGELGLAAALAQRDYYRSIKNLAAAEHDAISDLLAVWQNGRVEDEFERLTLPRKKLVTPVALSDEEYVRRWLEEPYPRKGFDENDPEYFSLKGERVRSKSEIILMDIFDSYPVPCKYEFPLELFNGKIIHPDFTLLNVRERKEYRWEHLGRADDPGYMKYNVGRLNDLIRSGYYPGVNLILSFETSDSPLDVRVVHNLINEYLLS